MNPLLFGSSERQLFGIHMPAAGRRQRRGVVICPPWGQEYLRAHRACRLLGERFVQNGCDVLRFDYFGSGDSAGESEDVTLEGCVQDAVWAVEELMDVAHVRRVTLVGLRLGGTVAAAAAAKSRAVDRVVLWDPISDGRAYVEDLVDSQGPPDADMIEVNGFPLTRALREEFTTIDRDWFGSTPDHVLIITSEHLDEHRRLHDTLRRQRAGAELEVLPNLRAWTEQEDFGVGAIPVDILQRIASWRN